MTATEPTRRPTARRLLSLLILLSAACASPNEVHESDVHVDVTGLERRVHPSGGLVYAPPGRTPLAEYAHFLIAPVEVLQDDPSVQSLGREDRERLQLQFFDAVTEELSRSGYSLAREAGPGVLAVHLTLEGVERGTDTGKSISDFMLETPVDVGAVTVQAVFRDAQTEKLEGVAVHRVQGTPLVLTSWNDAQSAFERWARIFREAIDAVRNE